MPFADNLVLEMLLHSVNKYEGTVSQEEFIKHIKKPPDFTIIRVNKLAISKQYLKEEVKAKLLMQYSLKGTPCPTVEFHGEIDDILIVSSNHGPKTPVEAHYPIAIVGLQCAISVLRGSQVYAPGVTALPSEVYIGDKVSVFADLLGQCKRGWNKQYQGETCFVGNGLLVQNRKDLFSVASPRGLAINMIEPLFDFPSIGDILVPNTGFQKGFLQNLPSVVCGHILQPQPHHLVLDMCAAPGGKTTHIASLMENKGEVIALDKSATKVLQIIENSRLLGLKNIRCFAFDSTKACIEIGAEQFQRVDSVKRSLIEPPFLPNSFDRILLDAPCSALGQRPQLHNPIRLKEVLSFSRLQKKLLRAAIQLLKIGGKIVYSTCTYNTGENEEIIDWALSTFPSIRVVDADLKLGKPGYRIGQLTKEDCNAMQRFGCPRPARNENSDTIGFFICCLEKYAPQ